MLLEIARESMIHGVDTGAPLHPEESVLTPALAAFRASFVTLMLGGELRGCTGSLEATQSLALDAAESACYSALSDPRFSPVQASEVADIAIEISVLSPLKPMPVRDEQDLLNQLIPGLDGLAIEVGLHRATFLPKVWEHLECSERFLKALKHKAGLPEDFWSDNVRLFRYHTETFAES